MTAAERNKKDFQMIGKHGMFRSNKAKVIKEKKKEKID